MTDTVVIEGEVSLVNQVEGEVELINQVDGDPEVIIVEGGGQSYPHYHGDYTVAPSLTAQVLETDGMVMDNDVTVEAVPQGSATTPATIITADPTISVSSGGLITAQVNKTQQITPTVQEGYVEEGTPGNVGVAGSNTQQLTTQGAQTIHPASTDQSIASGKYLTGAQTFKAVTVSGLTADKILQGNVIKIGDADDDDRIMSVTGTAQGGITPTGTKQIAISANGTVTEDVTNYASAEITTNVPASAVDTGTKSINSNGTHDVVGYASASVNVPNSYSSSDEGKVVSNGALVAQTSDTVTANDTYDTTLINSLTVNVSGGGTSEGWQRPSDFPNLSLLDRTGEVVYMTCMADEARGYFYIKMKTSNSQPYNVAIGTITNGTYVVEREFTLAHNTDQRMYFGTSAGGYKVIRFTPPSNGHITTFSTQTAYENAYWATDVVSGDQVPALAQWQGVVEIYGNLPYMNGELTCRANKLLKSFDVKNVIPSTLSYAFRYCSELENVDMSTWDTSHVTSADCFLSDCGALKYAKGINDIDLSNCTNLDGAFRGIAVDEVDMSNWNMLKVTKMTNMFASAKIKILKAVNSDIACSYVNAFSNCYYLQKIDISDLDLSMATSVDALFSNDASLVNIDFENLDFSSLSTAASTQNVVQGTKSLRSLTVPASLTIIGNGAFSNMESCSEYHFLATTPPTLNNTNVFNNMNTRVTKKIYVPYSADHSVLTAYQSATNWSTYASYIEEEPQ